MFADIPPPPPPVRRTQGFQGPLPSSPVSKKGFNSAETQASYGGKKKKKAKINYDESAYHWLAGEFRKSTMRVQILEEKVKHLSLIIASCSEPFILSKFPKHNFDQDDDISKPGVKICLDELVPRKSWQEDVHNLGEADANGENHAVVQVAMQENKTPRKRKKKEKKLGRKGPLPQLIEEDSNEVTANLEKEFDEERVVESRATVVDPEISIGSLIRIRGLEKRQDLNGLEASVESNMENGRYRCSVLGMKNKQCGEKIRCKRENFDVVAFGTDWMHG
eukprot:gnl/TRDRNA2_/TRDRNA2_177524_c0_seq1.p1 gnl/TRDRNA2_/TRDRNA2_177524_c0~~gnl/TRDRNA2_/TRDRNA2_177524_c0_seq1.p1  ORF type:complete len:278 (+),score=56.70 gnl/TRDRNA2_/TRDRNA2_177524_c0_seq1:116-949(+)